MRLILFEGDNDEELIKNYLSFLGYKDDLYRLYKVGGKSELKGKYPDIDRTIFKYSIDSILIIFDADGNYEESCNNIKNQIKDAIDLQELKIDIFLFPNNKDIGEVEDLYFKIARKKKIIVAFWYFLRYLKQKCNVKELKIEEYKKDTLYTYKDILIFKKKKKEKIINLEEFKEIFDLESKFLEPLKNFLTKQFNDK